MKRKLKINFLSRAKPVAFCLLPLFILLTPLHAEGPVRVHVTVLVASNEGSDFNLDNDAYRDELIQLFSYSAYRQSQQFIADLKKADRFRADLPDGYELVLTLQGEEKERALVEALIRKENKQYVNTVLSILKPGVVFLGGPPVTGGVLIIVLETSL